VWSKQPCPIARYRTLTAVNGVYTKDFYRC